MSEYKMYTNSEGRYYIECPKGDISYLNECYKCPSYMCSTNKVTELPKGGIRCREIPRVFQMNISLADPRRCNGCLLLFIYQCGNLYNWSSRCSAGYWDADKQYDAELSNKEQTSVIIRPQSCIDENHACNSCHQYREAIAELEDSCKQRIDELQEEICELPNTCQSGNIKIVREYCAEVGTCVIRSENYGSRLSYIMGLFKEARLDFPHLKTEEVKVIQYAGDRYARTYGIEFKMTGNIPESYSRIGRLERTW